MGAFLGISLWVALATVVPGFVTIASLYGAYATVNPQYVESFLTSPRNEWVLGAIAITIMVLTQALGILLEGFLVKMRWLGPNSKDITIGAGIDSQSKTCFTLKPYDEYGGIYILLAKLSESEDTQGHLKRALAQFFLTNNTLVSFGVGILATLLLMNSDPSPNVVLKGNLYLAVMTVCFATSYKVAKIRFEVMAKALWATRRNRIAKESYSDSKKD